MPWTDLSGLSKAAVILAAVFLLSLGSCSFVPDSESDLGLFITGIVMLASLFGLLVVGSTALLRRRQ